MAIRTHPNEMKRTEDQRGMNPAGVAAADRASEAVPAQRRGRGFAKTLVRLLVLPAAYGLAVVETILGFRLAFLMAGANPNNDFVDFIYQSGDPLAEPFQGLLASKTVDGGAFEQASAGVFEPANAIAMGVYMAVGFVLIGLIFLVTRVRSPGGERRDEGSRISNRTAAYEH